MEKFFFCTYWGSENMDWAMFLKKAAAAGYDGVEASLPPDPAVQKKMAELAGAFDLKLIGVHWDTVTPDFNTHKKELQARLLSLAQVNPMFITSHTGKDHFSFEQNVELLSLARQISESTGVTILHETHRGKFSFAAHCTRAFLEELPWLNLTLDISHWFNVAESFLQDQEEALALALSRTRHIHSRIGFTQGSQVNDPRNPEWQDALQQHLKHWDKVIALHEERAAPYFTFTSEFGPFPYMSSAPGNIPASAHQWDMNNYMKDLLKSRYYV
ncbi:sugar phosphate isomerase/epimerase family protein [Pedobacter heparinus]|uniref:sugar phosphate isomerase/epimerase family protein n=1 Tax=Pedobacter heparinus TaxID=984 RepID=UPI00292DAF89|nr:TIM barrel protein [Pedobacter heparinus]